MFPIDTSSFQIGVAPDEDPAIEQPLQDALRDEALNYIRSHAWAPPIEDIFLAFAVAPIVGLFLVRFTRGIWSGEGTGDREVWVVVGDLPPMYFSDEARTRAEAFETYFELAEDWADAVLAGEDTSQCFPIAAAPTDEHARMLKSRVEFMRSTFLPLVSEVEAPG